jgi:DNA repair exonuclease SbcCD nuclease subunit
LFLLKKRNGGNFGNEMERTKINKIPDLILCSDFHLREDIPTCWTGDFQAEQWDSMDFIKNLQKKYNCPVIMAGDVFHHWKASPWLLTETIKHLPAKFFPCLGQHDLPQHNIDLVNKSGFGTLREAEYFKTASDWELDVDIYFCHFGQIPPTKVDRRTKHILVWHRMVFHKEKPYPDCPSELSATLTIRKFPQFDLLLFGDNHKSFSVTYGDQLLVNPGSLTRQTADQMDFQPRVALWYAETNTIDWVNIPIQQGVISREHIERKEERNTRIDAFISKLDTDWKAEMSFEDNLEIFMKKNNTREAVQEIIYKSLEK